MPNWINFSTVEKWAKDNDTSTDCSRMCKSCEKTWQELLLEGKGDMAVHMIQLPQGEFTPCQLPYKFVCDECYLLDAIL